jgi:hypothetical protein
MLKSFGLCSSGSSAHMDIIINKSAVGREVDSALDWVPM